MRSKAIVPVMLALAVGAIGCGDGGRQTGTGGAGGAAVPDGGGSTDGGPFQAGPHPALPRVIDLGGPVLGKPKVLPILYSGDGAAADVTAFLQELALGAWSQLTLEYGVGALTVLPAVTLTTAAPPTISDSALQAALASNTSGAKPAWGAADGQTIYLFVLPEGTIEQDGTGACCTDYDGYHDESQVGSVKVAYAVSCACPGFDGPSFTPLQERTVDMSHELVEAATDPFPRTDPAYAQEDPDDFVWTMVTDGEVADMCEFNDDANVVPPGATYMIQRSWSNAAAARGDNPCLPAVTSAPYLNSFPALNTLIDDFVSQGFTTKGLSVPLNQKTTIALTLSSAAPTANTWSVQVYDYDHDVLGMTTAGLTLALDRSTGRNGDVLHLTLMPKKANAQIGGEAFVIVSDYGSPGDPDFESQLTMGLVTN